ncbi:hypothetical protein BO82DRAFT_376579 [Aspergillus uvarum CBS 121591]|uniref:Glutathione transferase n=1 Tax=Aspergillus uvarum CBS 121591 TaxID=1448315 RepID=A0A319BZR9_9EURO|nr:hypothetical protein BO82DRAFT_376579 [Aspergillus uvarum CBS 121591]PYH79256.1 hypothetical protein BO82DRAFT_376579 [Aspergillus uvarum CBS 121591]
MDNSLCISSGNLQRSTPHPTYLAPSLPSVAADASTLAASQHPQHHQQTHQFTSPNPNFHHNHQQHTTHRQTIPPAGDSHCSPGPSNSTPHQPQSQLHTQCQPLDIRTILSPPDLDLWRTRLFNVDELIVLSEEQFLTYFPHIDNVYSHRSTQHYKRKPLVSHYWDCRLKGRPPGTPKSTDPNKKKRKRTARERDLCDVKIKITEYFPQSGTGMGESDGRVREGEGVDGEVSGFNYNHQFGMLTPNSNVLLPEGHPGLQGQRFFTIQRVNGNGANGKNDGVGGGHRHTLEESDRVKKNSVQRFLLKEARQERKKAVPFSSCAMFLRSFWQTSPCLWKGLIAQAQPPIVHAPSAYLRSNAGRLQTRTMSNQNQPQKSYHTKATGFAAETVADHSADNDLKLFGSCFCPFVQRVWIALQFKGIPYQYIEVDPYKKPQSLLEVNPRGLVPALRHGDWSSHESTVLLEYLEDLNAGPPLLPPRDPKLRAHCRLWADYVNRHIVPTFYRVLQAQDQEKQISHAEELRDSFNTLIGAAHTEGPFFLGDKLSFVDVQVAPWIIRLRRVLKPYRGWPEPEAGSRWGAWVDAIEKDPHVAATTSDDGLYLDSYERYAGRYSCPVRADDLLTPPENRPNTSQLANAINSGRGLP